MIGKIAFGILILIVVSQISTEAQQPKSNILFIYADDMTYQALSGDEYMDVKTPNLDKLAKSGVTFTHCFNMGGWHGAVCVASRSMLLTGKYLWNARKEEENKYARITSERQMWPQLMKDLGYTTFMSGKWHVQGIAPEEVFDNTIHVRPGGMPETVKSAYNRPQQGKDDDWMPWDTLNGGFWSGGKHWSEVMADDAVAYLDNVKKSDKPFFMYLAFNAPHDPRQSPRNYVEMYNPENIAVPKNFLSEHPLKSEMGCGTGLRDE